MDARKGEKCSPSFDHQLSRDENMAEAGPEVERTDTGSNAGAECAERKRKRSSEKSQEVGPSGGGEIEEAMRNEEENKNAEINPLTIELQRIKWQKQQLEINHETMKSNMKKEMEEEMKKVKMMFEKKAEEETIKIQREQVFLGYAHQKLLWNQALAEWAAMNKSLAEQWSTSASSSSQVPQPTTQLPRPCLPQQICRAPAPAMRTAQAGGHSGSVLGPLLQHPNLTLWRPATHLARSRPHPSAIPPATSSPAPVASTSSLQHPDKAITAAPLAPAPHFTSFRPHPSVIPATSTPGATTSSATPLLPRPPTAPRAVLRAPAPHLRPHLSVTPGTSTTNPAPPNGRGWKSL